MSVGTLSASKGQHMFVRAIGLFCRENRALAARTRFILLGGRDSEFGADVQQLIASTPNARIELHSESSDNLPYFAAADITACSSYEESSPRVVVEGMACRVPVLASPVHGIPELVRPDQDATLVPAGDTAAWSRGLRDLLLDRDRAARLARSARARVERYFSAELVLPRHLALAGIVASGEG